LSQQDPINELAVKPKLIPNDFLIIMFAKVKIANIINYKLCIERGNKLIQNVTLKINSRKWDKLNVLDLGILIFKLSIFCSRLKSKIKNQK